MKIKLSSLDTEVLHDSWLHMNYSLSRGTEEEYNKASKDYTSLMNEIKISYNLSLETSVSFVHFGGCYMEVEV